ncbi:uncharacterized protein HMPREF1541_10915 [Cyphellophora europaea CBS 101466]|uniref:BHLH domain-containing protein n=1 Tax=Cyphellophora europaea (strain CBS 101466) TaxID=1220924 RepID=W2S609_CYPE1|nr:uncharacterized protein HMPREF1541_10915 [Cyphellophora europaea CBS 101466]ETN44050.1 hypothetical protein HMPREF1541_10915 [Cyphellophora europaea CBS 101466]
MEAAQRLSEPWPEYIPSPEFVASMTMMEQETSWYKQSTMFVPQSSLVPYASPTHSESLVHCTSPSEYSSTSEMSVFVQIDTPRPTDPTRQSRWPGRSKEHSRERRRRSKVANDDDFERAKLAHITAERRYRDNLNLRLSQLRQTLKNVGAGTSGRFKDDSSRPAVPGRCRSLKRKEDVLVDAIHYIQGAEVEIGRLKAQLNALKLDSQELDQDFKNARDNFVAQNLRRHV